MGSMELRGAAHRNMKLDCWELDFFGDNNVSLRYRFRWGNLLATNIPVCCTLRTWPNETDKQATAWRNIDRIKGQYGV